MSNPNPFFTMPLTSIYKHFVLLCICVISTITVVANNPDLRTDLAANPVQKRHSLGFQVNPCFGEFASFSPATNRYLLKSALRYTRHFSLNTTMGGELLAAHFQMGDNRYLQTLGTGAFGRYLFWQNSWLSTGIEANAFVVRSIFNDRPDTYPNHDLHMEYDGKMHFGYFVSPVVSLKKKDSRWSFDLMYKFTTRQLPNYWDKRVFSYRINYHF